MVTVHDGVRLALNALRRLAERGEQVEGEWQYVNDLEAAWRARLEEVAGGRANDPLSNAAHEAIQRLCVEADLIHDPHRAIDWLSTLPQAALLALGEST